jgi:transcriptional coactivator HFI1/ADA1
MNPADLTLSISPNLTSRPIPPALTITPKNGRIPVPRVELESIYTQLKSALGDGWNEYKEVVGRFVCGM